MSNGGAYRIMLGNTSLTTASTLSSNDIGVPPSGSLAFLIKHITGAGDWHFVHGNRYYAPPPWPNNGLGAYPTTNVKWDDAAWGRAPGRVTWYDDGDFVLDATPNTIVSCTVTVGSGWLKYYMYLAWYHQIELRNDSSEDINIKARGYLGHQFSQDGLGSLRMTQWYTHKVPANDKITIGYYEPMEIKFTSDDNLDAIGVTTQKGDKYLLMGDN